MTTHRALVTCAVLLLSTAARAQGAAGDYVDEAPRAAIDARLLIERAVRDIIIGQSTQAIAPLTLAIARDGVALDGDDPRAVLLRLASALSVRRGGSTLPERCAPEGADPVRCAIDRASRAIAEERPTEAIEALDRVMPVAVLPRLRAVELLRRVARGRMQRLPMQAARPPATPWAWAPRSRLAPVLQQPEQSGMSGVETAALYVTSGVYGLGLGAWLASTAVRDEDGAHTVILPLLGAGLGVSAGYLIDRFAGVRRGRALAVQGGMWLGLIAGIGVVGAEELSFDRDEVNLAPHVMFLSSTAGMVLGAAVAELSDARPGSVSFTFSAGLWGSLAGAMIELSAHNAGRRRTRDRFPAAGILIGEGVGIATGMILSRFIEPTAAQARWMDLGAVGGASVGVAIGALTSNDSAMAPFLGCAVGLAGGMILGYVLGRPSPEERQMHRERDGVRTSAFITPVQGGAVVGLSLL